MKRALLLMMMWLPSGCFAPTAPLPEFPRGAVAVYMRAGCPYCAQAIEQLHAAGIEPVFRDVSRQRSALRELRAIYRKRYPGEEIIVPVLVYNGRYLRGYHPQALKDFLSHADLDLAHPVEACPPSLNEEEYLPAQ